MKLFSYQWLQKKRSNLFLVSDFIDLFFFSGVEVQLGRAQAIPNQNNFDSNLQCSSLTFPIVNINSDMAFQKLLNSVINLEINYIEHSNAYLVYM